MRVVVVVVIVIVTWKAKSTPSLSFRLMLEFDLKDAVFLMLVSLDDIDISITFDDSIFHL